MTPNEFRKMALSLPETIEASHMDHPDFRVGGKIFATLSPAGQGWAMVKLSAEQQQAFVRDEPKVFAAFNGKWGKWGATKVILRQANKNTVRTALAFAWRNTAPKRLVNAFDSD
jgi:hypothetical protein